MVILDETGNFIAASNDKLEFAQDSLTVEAYVVTYRILLSQTFGCNQIIMSSDSMQVVEIMRNGGHVQGVGAASRSPFLLPLNRSYLSQE
jgi:hypothetical protein